MKSEDEGDREVRTAWLFGGATALGALALWAWSSGRGGGAGGNPYDLAGSRRLLDRLADEEGDAIVRSAGPGAEGLAAAVAEARRHRHDHDPRAFLAAMDRVLAQSRRDLEEIRKDEPPARPGSRAARMKCGVCDGLGWYVCRACNGSGTNRSKPSPRYTGVPWADALVAFKHDATCHACKGYPEVRCSRCRGEGYLE